jgi:hypothetical protein
MPNCKKWRKAAVVTRRMPRQVLGMQQQVNAATQQQVATVTRTAAVTGQITTRLGGAREAATQRVAHWRAVL